jgi:2-polyprenyl-3-methyl-5-hydroxy-6-metoxy-1,4-benzoquinol methylase
MNTDKETFETWNKVAQIYEDKFMNLDLYNETYDLFCDLIDIENPKILELGCGPGNITKYIDTIRPYFAIDAIDMAPNMIELAKKNCPSVNFTVMDIRLISQLTSKYEGIMCGFCIPYISHFISDASFLLTQSGVLYLSFVDGNYSDSGFKTGSTGDRTYFYYHSLVGITKLLEIQAFKILHLIPVLYPYDDETREVHTIIIAQK